MKTQTKIIIRRLPHGLTKDQFRNLIQPYDKFKYFRFCCADKSHKEFASARAYIDFFSEDEMYKFKNDFDNKLFIDGDGNEGYGIIEFAVSQTIPEKGKFDAKQNTLATDADFIKFLHEMNEQPKNISTSTAESNLEEIKKKESEKGTVSTALIEYINNLPKKEHGRREDFRRKPDFPKPFLKKYADTAIEHKSTNKTEIKAVKKNNFKETSAVAVIKPDIIKNNDKLDGKKTNMSKRNDIKAYAANYEEYAYDLDGYGYERNSKRGFENKNYRGDRYDYVDESKGTNGGSYYYPRKDYGRSEGYYHGYDYYGYPDHTQATYTRANTTNKTKRSAGGGGGGTGRRPPTYSDTRKD